MIEEVRKAYQEKTIGLDQHLQRSEDQLVYNRFAHEVHQHLIKTRRALQGFFDSLEMLPSNYKTAGNVTELARAHQHKKKDEDQKIDLVVFFTAIQKAASTIVKGGLHLRQQNLYKPTKGDADLVDDLLEEGKKIVVFCEEHGLPPHDAEFLRRTLATMGYEGFKKLLEDPEFEVLRKKPVLFQQAVLHQQGDPVAFLRSKTNFVKKGAEELKACGKFDDLAKGSDEIYIEALLHYADNKRFSNPHDYLVYLRNERKRRAEKGKRKKRSADIEW